jgi:hypothetical protein
MAPKSKLKKLHMFLINPDLTRVRYMIRKAKKGVYEATTNYYGGGGGGVCGPTTIILYFFTNYGRENERMTVTTTRLEGQRANNIIGTITI